MRKSCGGGETINLIRTMSAAQIVAWHKSINGHSLMTPEQMVTLAAFAVYERIEVKHLAEMLGISDSAGPRRVEPLLRLGFIKRSGRGVYEITEKGRAESTIQFN